VKAVLSIDAAWTVGGSSGVPLLRIRDGEKSIVASAHSHAAFVGLADGKENQWTERAAGGSCRFRANWQRLLRLLAFQ
jgi:hypothetical protein